MAKVIPGSFPYQILEQRQLNLRLHWRDSLTLLTRLSSKTCPFDNCAGLILKNFATPNDNRRNGSAWHALNGPETWSSPTTSPSTLPSAPVCPVSCRQLSKCRVMVSRRCGHWHVVLSSMRNAKDASRRCEGQNFRISWRTRSFYFEKTVRPLTVAYPDTASRPGFRSRIDVFSTPSSTIETPSS